MPVRPNPSSSPRTLRVPTVTRRVGRLSVAAGLLALALTGCTTFQKGSTAAFVDGQPISTSEVAQVTQQYNDNLSTSAQDRLQEPQTLGLLILAPFVLDQAKASGSWVPDERYNAALAKVPDASQGTKDLVGVSIALQPGVLSDADVTAIVAALKKADVQLDPRYGTFDPSTGGFLPPNNNWIRPTPTPPQAPAGSETQGPTEEPTAPATAPATTGP
jgi:hypothetical protein